MFLGTILATLYHPDNYSKNLQKAETMLVEKGLSLKFTAFGILLHISANLGFVTSQIPDLAFRRTVTSCSKVKNKLGGKWSNGVGTVI